MSIWLILGGILVVVTLLSIYVSTRKSTCDYKYSTGKYCKKEAKWLHLPNWYLSCDEHSSYFRESNDKLIDLNTWKTNEKN